MSDEGHETQTFSINCFFILLQVLGFSRVWYFLLFLSLLMKSLCCLFYIGLSTSGCSHVLWPLRLLSQVGFICMGLFRNTHCGKEKLPKMCKEGKNEEERNMMSTRKTLFVMFFLLKIGHYNNIDKHLHIYFFSLLRQGNIVPQRTNLNIWHFHAYKNKDIYFQHHFL